MLGKKYIKTVGAVFALMAAVVFLSLTAAEAAGTKKTVQLTAGAASTIDLGHDVADILVANPAVADVGTLRSNRLYVVGRTVGSTNVLAFDAGGNELADIAVQVSMDEAGLRDAIKSFFPKEDVEVRTVGTNVILSGSVSTPSVANQVRDIASRFVPNAEEGQTIVDLMKVDGEQQVMLQVKVIEAARSVLREYNAAAELNTNGFPNFPAPGTGNAFAGVAGTGLQELAPFGIGQLFVTKEGVIDPLRLSVRGLERDGLINILAEPNLTAISGETAGFLAGGEFPVPTGRDQDGNITIEFRQFGVSLNFTPTVLSDDLIAMQLSTEVSSKSADDGVILVNTQVPGLKVRRAETTVQMGSGGTLMIAGLITSDDVHTLTGFPGLQDIPILGELFKSKSFARNETELVILVTPYLVQPYANPVAEVVSSDAEDAMTPKAIIPDVRKSSGKPLTLDSYTPPKDIKKLTKEDMKKAKIKKRKSASYLRQGESRTAGRSAIGLESAVKKAPVTTAAGNRKPFKPAPLKADPITAVSLPAKKVQKIESKKQETASLKKTFVSNLRQVYGSRVPQVVNESDAYGYIVD